MVRDQQDVAFHRNNPIPHDARVGVVVDIVQTCLH